MADDKKTESPKKPAPPPSTDKPSKPANPLRPHFIGDSFDDNKKK